MSEHVYVKLGQTGDGKVAVLERVAHGAWIVDAWEPLQYVISQDPSAVKALLDRWEAHIAGTIARREARR